MRVGSKKSPTLLLQHYSYIVARGVLSNGVRDATPWISTCCSKFLSVLNVWQRAEKTIQSFTNAKLLHGMYGSRRNLNSNRSAHHERTYHLSYSFNDTTQLAILTVSTACHSVRPGARYSAILAALKTFLEYRSVVVDAVLE